MYIWENHMGGLYTTEYDQNYEDLYCEQCGDSDWFVGTADTAKEAWQLLWADLENEGDDIECLPYNVEYIMKFLEENFEIENPTYVYLIGRNEENDDLFGKWLHDGSIEFLYSYCIDEKYADAIAEQLSFALSEPDCESIKKVGRVKHNNKTIIVYTCIDKKPQEGAYWNGGENWVGFFDTRDNRIKKEDKNLMKELNIHPKKRMTVRKLLKKIGDVPENTLIMYRFYVDIPDMDEPYDSLFGYCRYRNGELVPEDGDSYYLDDVVVRFEDHLADKEEPYICVWIATTTIPIVD